MTEDQGIAARVGDSRAGFLGLLAELGLDPRADADRAVAGGWTLKDVLGHIACWEDWAAERLRARLEGRPVEPIPQDYHPWVEAFNEREWQARRGRSPEEILQEWEEAHRKLLGTLERVRGPAALRGDWRWLAEHYQEHARDIAAEAGRQPPP